MDHIAIENRMARGERLYVTCKKDPDRHQFKVIIMGRDHVFVHATAFDCAGDGIEGSYDTQGNCIRRMLISDIDALMDEFEADQVLACRKVDQDMLDNAY